jgi:hypothetical protein
MRPGLVPGGLCGILFAPPAPIGLISNWISAPGMTAGYALAPWNEADAWTGYR